MYFTSTKSKFVILGTFCSSRELFKTEPFYIVYELLRVYVACSFEESAEFW